MPSQFSNRSVVMKVVFIVVGVVFVIRLSILQLFNPDYKKIAEQQSLRDITQYPSRGFMYDRNGELLVHNEAVYDLMVIPRMVKNLDTNYFCNAVGITREEFDEKMANINKRSRYAAADFIKQISKEDYAKFENKMYKFNGFYISQRTLRMYDRPVAAQVLGYVGEVNNKEIENDGYYAARDYIGKSGLEKSYEPILRGVKGKKVMKVDVHNREIGPYKGGEEDIIPQEGMNLYTTLDAELQQYIESLMANKRGAVVAIEPSTGEILAMVSAPFYDPNILVGSSRSKNYSVLTRDISKPMFNRAVQSQYAPGSTFKVAQAITALDLGVVTPQYGVSCDKSLVGCHNHPSAMSVQEGIKMSCNPYFYRLCGRIIQQDKYRSIYDDSPYGLTIWNDYMHRFGFGQRPAIDLPLGGISSGFIPDTAFYNKRHGRRRWAYSTIYSISIGQGEVTASPLQLANLAAIVANRGYYITPHLVRYYGRDTIVDSVHVQKYDLGIERRYFDLAAKGMYDVVHAPGGTAHKAAVQGISICGKTGTAQNYGNDHSMFIAFAPQDNPQIAIAVCLENAHGGGGSWAAPIAGLIIEKYINKEVARKDVERQYKEINPCQKLPLTRRVQKPKKK